MPVTWLLYMRGNARLFGWDLSLRMRDYKITWPWRYFLARVRSLLKSSFQINSKFISSPLYPLTYQILCVWFYFMYGGNPVAQKLIFYPLCFSSRYLFMRAPAFHRRNEINVFCLLPASRAYYFYYIILPRQAGSGKLLRSPSFSKSFALC